MEVINNVGAITAQKKITLATKGAWSIMRIAPCSKFVCSVMPSRCTEIKGKQNAGIIKMRAVIDKANKTVGLAESPLEIIRLQRGHLATELLKMAGTSQTISQ